MTRKWYSLISQLNDISDPVDYFSGISRQAELAPDNLLLFVRRADTELYPVEGATSFHQRWVLLINLLGSGTVEVDRANIPLQPGMCLLVPPLRLHGYRKVDRAIQWLFITFEWPGHSAAEEMWSGPRPLDLAAGHLLGSILDLWSRSPRDGDFLAIRLLNLLRHLYPSASTPPDSSALPSLTGGLLAAVLESVRNQPGINLTDLARQVGISESHLRARFRHEVGLSLGRYLREFRLRQSVLWLRHEHLSVKDAALRAGYPDIFSFSRAFRRLFGYPPSSLRQPSPPRTTIPYLQLNRK